MKPPTSSQTPAPLLDHSEAAGLRTSFADAIEKKKNHGIWNPGYISRQNLSQFQEDLPNRLLEPRLGFARLGWAKARHLAPSSARWSPWEFCLQSDSTRWPFVLDKASAYTYNGCHFRQAFEVKSNRKKKPPHKVNVALRMWSAFISHRSSQRQKDCPHYPAAILTYPHELCITVSYMLVGATVSSIHW